MSLQILDATLREGEQTAGVCFDEHIKLAIAELLDEIGIDIIEAGHPLVSPEIASATRTIAASGRRAVVAAHARSMRDDIDRALDCGVGFLGIFYCVSSERLSGVFRTDLDRAIARIEDAVAYARERSPEVLIRYTPEDTVRSPFENVVRAATAAVRAGADIISIADTTGYMVPGTERDLGEYVMRLRSALHENGCEPRIAVHCHNDRGLALANALSAYRAGADIIDASVMGLGERCGIVDLAQLLAVLSIDHGFDHWNLERLPELYSLVARHAGVDVYPLAPIVGRNAFTHCAGVHTHAAAINPMHYESVTPDRFGRERTFALDHMSGIASVRYALSRIGEDEEMANVVLARVKEIGRQGKTVDLEELQYVVRSCRAAAELSA